MAAALGHAATQAPQPMHEAASMAKSASFLDRQYTVFGKVIEGMEFVDKIKRGDENNNGSVSDPDKIISFKSK